MSKCHGCGIELQNFDNKLLGYTKNLDSDLCERCFRIKHYNDYQKVIKDNNWVFSILKSIKPNALVVLVIDIINIPLDFSFLKNLKNDILLVFSKADLLPSEMYDQKLEKIANSLNINYVDKMIVSANKNYNLDELMFKIKTLKKSNDVYFIGYSNSGKSTLLNKIIYNYTSLDLTITTSLLPSTTLDLINIPISDDLNIIDTPGLLEEGNILDFAHLKELKKIMPINKIRPRIYQIKGNQVLDIDGLIKIQIEDLNDIIFYISNALKIDRTYNQKIKGDIFNIEANSDLVLTGLGFIKFKKKCQIVVSSKYNIKIYTRKSLM